MKMQIAAAAVAMCAGAALAQPLAYQNGPWIDGYGDGVGGANTSAIQTGFNTFGYGWQSVVDRSVADDMYVCFGPLDVQKLVWYGYQSGSSTTSTYTAVGIEVYDGPPGAGGTVIWGDRTVNTLVSTNWTGVYRTTATTRGTASTRPVMRIECDISACPDLAAGSTYWFAVMGSGSLASGPWANPTVPQATTDNGRQGTGGAAGTWVQISDAVALLPQDFPFLVRGNGGCVADVDHDCFLTGDDITLWVTWFEAGDERSDADGDGFPTGDDATLVVSTFETGC